MSDGYRQLDAAGYALLKDGNRLLVDADEPCCCEDLGPPECECEHSLPTSNLTVDFSATTIVPPGGACPGETCTGGLTTYTVYRGPGACFWENSGLCVRGYFALALEVGFDTGRGCWIVSIGFACNPPPDNTLFYAIWLGGTDPCDPTGEYIADSNVTGNVTVGVP